MELASATVAEGILLQKIIQTKGGEQQREVRRHMSNIAKTSVPTGLIHKAIWQKAKEVVSSQT